MSILPAYHCRVTERDVEVERHSYIPENSFRYLLSHTVSSPGASTISAARCIPSETTD